MNYSLIGTGNVAWFFGKRLKETGHNCVGVYGRNARIANALAKELYADDLNFLTDVKDNADICIIAVSDSAIEGIAQELSFHNTVLVHTAGAMSINVLQNAADDRGIIWPAYSILKADLPLHRDIPLVWEASSEKAESRISAVVDAISDLSYEAKEEQRKWLHISAVFGNNFINHLMAICEQICKEQHIPFAILMPILQQTFNRIKQKLPDEMQTGPAKRGDVPTMENHAALLATHPEWQEIYRALSMSIEKMYNKP